jgi:hypothetical protein
MCSRRVSLADAHAHVQRARGLIRPNNGFWRQLIAYEESLYGTASLQLQATSRGKALMPLHRETEREREMRVCVRVRVSLCLCALCVKEHMYTERFYVGAPGTRVAAVPGAAAGPAGDADGPRVVQTADAVYVDQLLSPPEPTEAAHLRPLTDADARALAALAATTL